MIGPYDLVALLSWIVAAFASHTALDLAGRVSVRQGRASWIWLFGGAFSMGTGIWAMHFIGMLAFRLPIGMAYDGWINAASWLIAMAVSGVALFVVRNPAMTARNLTIGATLMGIGISVYPEDGKDFAALMTNADMAMYHAKKKGGSFRSYMPEMRIPALDGPGAPLTRARGDALRPPRAS